MAATSLSADELVLAYERVTVVHGVSLRLRPGVVTALVGPNGSGKSTLLRSLARLHRIGSGRVSLTERGEAHDIATLSAKEFARRVTMLSQSRPHPNGLDVRDVVAFGRHPHRRRFAPLSRDDRDAIERALELAGMTELAQRPVDHLSGGELQRVWLATCLAQQTDVLLFDEPTNHLDLRYQIETLDLIRDLADHQGTAVGVVLHDLNQAAAVADHVALLSDGRVRAAGSPSEVFTADHLTAVYGLPIRTVVDPDSGLIRVEPVGRHHTARLDRTTNERNR